MKSVKGNETKIVLFQISLFVVKLKYRHDRQVSRKRETDDNSKE